MSHTIIILEVETGKTQFINHDSFAVDFSKYEKEGHMVSVCLQGGEGEAIKDMKYWAANPEPVGYHYDMDYEPEYTLGGGWAAYDAR